MTKDILYMFLLTIILTISTYGLPIDTNNPTIPEQNIQFVKTNYITPKNEQLIEGDIRTKPLELRMAVQNKELIWTSRIIPYTLDSSFNDRERENITKSMNEIQSKLPKTCITFQERTIETDYLQITKTPGCYSSVGRDGGAQTLSLGDGCTQRGTIYHEIMHALGFWHEHNRPDRDKYISIIWENIKQGHHMDYMKMPEDEIDLLNETYDYGSIMHYSQKTFVKDPQDNSMKTFSTTSRYQDHSVIIGQRTKLSSLDLQKIQKLYNCKITDCLKPSPDLKYGYKSTDATKIGTNVVYKCNDAGNTLVGPTSIFCKDDGTWSGFEPQCLNRSRVKYCSFDSRSSKLCDWTQDTASDDIDWKWSSNETNTKLTGPTVDNTYENGKGGFLYVESSWPVRPGQKARLISGLIKSPQEMQCVSLFYHMYGKTMGNLTIYARMEDTTKMLIYRRGDSGNAWHHLETNFDPINADYRIVIEASVDGSWSDIGIDDVIIKDCSLGRDDDKSTAQSSLKQGYKTSYPLKIELRKILQFYNPKN